MDTPLSLSEIQKKKKNPQYSPDNLLPLFYYKSSYWESYEKGVTHKPGESDVNRLDTDFRDGLKYLLFKSLFIKEVMILLKHEEIHANAGLKSDIGRKGNLPQSIHY